MRYYPGPYKMYCITNFCLKVFWFIIKITNQYFKLPAVTCEIVDIAQFAICITTTHCEEFTGSTYIIVEILDRQDMRAVVRRELDRQMVFTFPVIVRPRI